MKESRDHEFTAPLDGARSGRLILAPGAGDVQIKADERLPGLCRVQFEGCVPGVQAEEGVVTIRYRSVPFVDWLGHPRQPRAAIRLNGSIPWEIELRGSLSHLAADLAGLLLRSLDLNSSAAQVQIRLPRPSGTVYVHAAGSLGSLVLRRPAGVALRIQVSGSSSRLACDGQELGPAPGGLQWQTPGYPAEIDRYDVRISGSAGELGVTTW